MILCRGFVLMRPTISLSGITPAISRPFEAARGRGKATRLMVNKSAVDIDNRDPSQMYKYLEARIDVLKRRLAELEEENQRLRNSVLFVQRTGESDLA